MSDEALRARVAELEQIVAQQEHELAALRSPPAGNGVQRERAEALEHAGLALFLDGPIVVFRWVAREGWPVEFVSPNVTQFGYTVAQFTNGDILFAAVVHPDDYERVCDEVRTYTAAKVRAFEQDYRLICADGRVRWVYDYTVPVWNEHGVVTHYDGYVLDITERKQMESALRESEARYRAVVEDQTELICRFRADGQLTFVNEVYARYFGRSRDELIGMNFLELLPEADQAEAQSQLDTLSAATPTAIYEHRVIASDGRIGWQQWTDRAILDEWGRVVEFQSVGRDITQRKQMEEALQEANDQLEARVRERTADLLSSQQLLENVFLSLRDAVFLVEADTIKIVYCNPAASVIFGYSYNEMIGKTTAMLHVDSDSLNTFRSLMCESVARDGFFFLPRFQMRRRDGTIFDTEHSVVPLENEQGERVRWVSVVRDISDRVGVEEALHESEERYRTLVETSPSAILLTDMSGTIQFCNRQAVQLFGYNSADALCGRNGTELIIADLPTVDPLAYMQEIIQSGHVRNIEYVMRRADGSRFPAEVSSSVVRDRQGFFSSVIIVVNDGSERKKWQARLLENERFAANGRLVASVAHEINTPLQSLQTSLEMVEIAPDEKRRMFLSCALGEIQRVGRIVRQLLDLYRPGALRYGPVDVNALVDGLLLLTGKRLKDQQVSTECVLSPDTPSLGGGSDELRQILLNLMMNALDAMPQGGRLQLETRVTTADAVAVGQPQDNLARAWLQVVVADTGCGMSEELQQRIFEPFVTTKEQGTGMGLAISKQLAEQQGGLLEVESTPGAGSRFTVTLPLE